MFIIQFHYRQSDVVQRLVLVAREGYAFSKDFAPRMKTLNQVKIDLLLHNFDITYRGIDRQTKGQGKSERERVIERHRKVAIETEAETDRRTKILLPG